MAEAVVIVGLLASIASLIELSAKVVSRLHDFNSKSSEVPKSFHFLSTRLSLLTTTLQHIQSQAESGRFSDDTTKALKSVVDDTFKQVSDIQISLFKVISSDSVSKLERTLKALKSLVKEDKVQKALEKISKNNEFLVLHQTTQHVDMGDRILKALPKLSVTSATLSNSSSNIPFRRDSDFVDLGVILDQLHQKCTLPASRTALVGFGEVGKSQLVIELGYRIRERSSETWMLWMHAGISARFEQSFRDIADFIEISGRQNLKWLLALDNVDNSDLLSEAGDAGEREQGAGVNGERRQPIHAALKLVEEKDIVALQSMIATHAQSLFERKLGSLDQGDDTAELAAALKFMSLGIREVLVRNRAEIENDHRSQKDHDEHDNREEEEDVEDNVSKSSEDGEFEDDVQTLRDYSFLFVGTNGTFEMHALVQLTTRK
ncbi:MAG: hypothetical protein Q9191_006762 [Dirinaria sp. TL-2023a]